jgi:hypothetical protein
MQRFVNDVTVGEVQLPIDDDELFLQMFKRFIEEDFKGKELVHT